MFGTCCLCGADAELSFEHVPPHSAFNDKRIFEADVRKLIEGGRPALAQPEGKINQRGAGRHTLCVPCNSSTGAWYGSAYVAWARDGMRVLSSASGAPSLYIPFKIYPLRVLKQAIVMFFSACGAEFQKKHPDLVRFALNRTHMGLPKKFRVFACYCDLQNSMATRQAGLTGMLRGSSSYVFAEIAFPPFGLILSVDSPPPDPRLQDISHFATYEYGLRRTVFLQLPVLPVVSYFPGDFRTEKEFKAARGAP